MIQFDEHIFQLGWNHQLVFGVKFHQFDVQMVLKQVNNKFFPYMFT